MEMEMVRKIILEQEAQFRQQVQELHRVYRVQKLLLQDLRPPRAIDSSRLELASGYDGSGKKSDAKPRRRTFDLELPAEEYMDVEMEEPSSNAATTTTANNNNNSSSAACDLVSRLSAAAAATAATAAPAPAMNSVKNLDSSAAVHEKVGSQQQIGWNSGRDGESEIFQMIKRAKSSGSDGGGGGGGGGFKQQQQQVLPCVTQGILGGIWGYGFDNTGGAQALRNAAAAAVEKSRAPPNGFHLAASDKVSKPQQQQQQQQQEVLSTNSKAAENQHVVFLEPGPNNRFAAENGKGLGGSSSSSSGIENLNPFFASAAAAAMERGPSAEDNGKFFGASLGGLQNHVSYSSQGILIPSTNMARREPVPPPSSSSSSSSAFMEASPGGLGLWWKSNSNYYHQPQQPQYQQVAVLQAGTPAQSVQVAWQGGSGFATTSPSPSSHQQQHHHAAVLGVVPPPPPPAAPPPASYASNNNKEESGGGSGCWLKGASSNASTAPSPGFLYSASTPPKPPFKKPPKLILDGATMELKLAPLDRDGPPVVGLLRQHGDETAAAALVVATDQRKRGDSTESPVNGSEVAKLEAGEPKDESKPKGLDLNPPGGLGLSSSDKPNSGLLDVVKAIKQDAQVVERDEVLQERRGGSRDETDLGRCEEAPSCSCSQPGCPICDTGSVEDVQVKQRSGKIEKVAVRSSSEQQQQQQHHKAREEVRDSAEPPAAPPTSSKKRRFKLVSSKDLLATRESDNATTNGKKRPDAIAEELDSRTGELSRDGEGEKKKRKHLVNPKSLKSSSSSKSHSSHQGLKEKESSTLKASPSVSRHKEKDKDKDKAGSNGYSFLADNPDDGANLAAEILVSLAPAKRDHVQPEKNGDSGVLRLHHKSKRRLIETLPTGVANHAAPPAAAAAAPPKPSPAVAEPVKDESKKKKKKKSKNSKTIVAKFQESVVAAEDPPKASFKSVKVALTQCEGGGGGGGGGNGGAATEAPKSSSKIKKKLVTKKQQQQQQQQNHHQQHQHHTPSSRSSKSSAGAARDLSSTTNITKAVNSSSKPRDHRDGGGHAHPHHETKRISSASSNYGSNNSTSEQESLDRLSQQQQQQNSGENSSEEIMGKESDEFEEWSRRSWGPAARRKRMRRSRPGL